MQIHTLKCDFWRKKISIKYMTNGAVNFFFNSHFNRIGFFSGKYLPSENH